VTPATHPAPASGVHDVLVVGGGVNGAGIARDAAGRDLSVLLVEQDDLASHTSSASTKLIHGGLRYLEFYDFGLVRKALQEREVLLTLAPHIVWPLRFVMPHDRHLRPAWMIRAGCFCTITSRAASVLPPRARSICAPILPVRRSRRSTASVSSTRMRGSMIRVSSCSTRSTLASTAPRS
jgi:glycerol-3-phosphate dehydrogenase